jgi:hypothetical protein
MALRVLVLLVLGLVSTTITATLRRAAVPVLLVLGLVSTIATATLRRAAVPVLMLLDGRMGRPRGA